MILGEQKKVPLYSSNLSDFYESNNVNDLEGSTVYRKFRARQSDSDVVLTLSEKRRDHVAFNV
jgi:hypothetical protein